MQNDLTKRSLASENPIDYQIEGLIGKGSFSKIYRAKNVKLNRTVVLKVIKNPKKYNKLIQREIDILSQLNHPNVIRLYNTINDPKSNTLYMVLEYCGRGDLSRYIKGRRDFEGYLYNGSMSIETINNIAKQIAKGIKYLRSKNIIHRDLKPANLLMNEQGIIKIADLGFAKESEITDLSQTLCGSPMYMAPEILQKNPRYTPKADLWSVGVMLYQFVYSVPPYKAKNIIELHHSLKKFRRPKFPESERTHKIRELGLVDLIVKLLKVDPEQRITFEDFFDHIYFKELDSESESESEKESEPEVKSENTKASKESRKRFHVIENYVPQEPKVIKKEETRKTLGFSYLDISKRSGGSSFEIKSIKVPRTNPFKSGTLYHQNLSSTEVKNPEKNKQTQTENTELRNLADIGKVLTWYIIYGNTNEIQKVCVIIVYCTLIHETVMRYKRNSIKITESEDVLNVNKIRGFYSKLIDMGKEQSVSRTLKVNCYIETYKVGLDEGRLGGVSELMGEAKVARYKYKISKACFEMVYQKADEVDRNVLRYFIDEIGKREKICKHKLMADG